MPPRLRVPLLSISRMRKHACQLQVCVAHNLSAIRSSGSCREHSLQMLRCHSARVTERVLVLRSVDETVNTRARSSIVTTIARPSVVRVIVAELFDSFH